MDSELQNRLKIKRFEFNRISQDELAMKLGISAKTLDAIENGKYIPSTKLSLQLAAYFKCSVEEIFYLEDKK